MKNKRNKKTYPSRSLIPSVLSVSVMVILFAVMPVTAQIPDEYRPAYENAVAAGLDAERLEAFFDRARTRQIPANDIDNMVASAITLAEQDLPYHPVLQKSMEGMAKQVPPSSIIQVLGQMERGFIQAATIVDPWLGREEVRSMIEAGRGAREVNMASRAFREMILENTSYALQLKIREESISDFLDQVISERATVRSGMTPVASAVRALADLPTSENDLSMSNSILVRALNSGFSATEIQQLPDAFRSAQFRSQLPVENIARGLQRQIGDGIPAQHILDNLFQGKVGGGPPGFTPPGLDRDNDRGEDNPGRGRRPNTPPGRK